MFDNMNIIKAYKIEDSLTGNNVEIVTFNANLVKSSNISIYMNINYPNLYEKHKDNILIAYREFNAEITSLACSMGLAKELEGNVPSILSELEPIKKEFKEMTINVFNEVIQSLGNIQVNPVPTIEYQRYK